MKYIKSFEDFLNENQAEGLNEFKMFGLFKKKESKPTENEGGDKKNRENEKFLELVKTKGDDVEYNKIVKDLKRAFGDKFDEKDMSDFSSQKWKCCYGDDTVDDLDGNISCGAMKSLESVGDNFGNKAKFYRFVIYSKNEKLDVICIHAWDYPLKGSYDEDEEYTNCMYVSSISSKL